MFLGEFVERVMAFGLRSRLIFTTNSREFMVLPYRLICWSGGVSTTFAESVPNVLQQDPIDNLRTDSP